MHDLSTRWSSQSQALGVRVLDAVRSGRRTFGRVDVVHEERDVTGSAA